MWSNLCQENSGVCLVSGSHSFANSNMMGDEAANILCFLRIFWFRIPFLVRPILPLLCDQQTYHLGLFHLG